MRTALHVPESLINSVKAFLQKESIALEVDSSDEHCKVRCDQPDETIECDLSTLHTNGWITCTTARAIADDLNIGMGQMGRLMDFLSIKIRRCELECFK